MIEIVDPGQTLSTVQSDNLQHKASVYPFDLHVFVGSAGSRSSFEQQVAAYVPAGSRMVSVGVDPIHHFTFVRSSASLGVPAGPQVAQAGNPFFRSGNLVDGIDAIAAKANELKVEPVAAKPFVAAPNQRVIESQSGVPIVIQENHTSAGVWWGTGAFLLAASLVVGWFVWRSRKVSKAAEEAREAMTVEAAEYAAKNIEVSRSWELLQARKPKSEDLTPRPAPQPIRKQYTETKPVRSRRAATVVQSSPVIINPPGNNGALNMLLGYELGRESARPAYSPPTYVPPPVVESTPSSSFWSSSSDSDSSSSSSWSSGSDSSSSSSFDFGSSFDSGGSSSGSDW